MKYFKMKEFECHDGCEMPAEARENIEALVEVVPLGFRVKDSGFRVQGSGLGWRGWCGLSRSRVCLTR